MSTVLLTGGAGYIGSHTCVELIAAGWQVIVVDNLANSSPKVLDRIERVTGVRVRLYHADIQDAAAMERVFSEERIDAVIHFAGLKAVGESVSKPIEYYRNNVAGTLVLLDAMRGHGVSRIVFSSSATVYSPSEPMPLTESSALGPINPYGRT
ncbi:MAG TPA: SDR family NAD(P)-dependent oxidoreductase, partial [Burkholderiales bacterium]|nr:SDR family NAD(P)-dependent oxidoreductase [Burkholderiales bacterium]